MANRFSVQPASIEGLGQIATALGQKRQQDQMMEQKKAGASNAMKFLNQANMTDDKIEKEKLFMMAYDASPEFTKGLLNNIKTRGEGTKLGAETLGVEEETKLTGAKITSETDKIKEEIRQLESGGVITPYQEKTIELENKKLEIEKLKEKSKIAADKKKQKGIDNKLKKEAIELARLEREEAAEKKGGEVQKMLRDASESDKKASSFARRMSASANELDNLESQIDPTSRVIGYISGGTGITSEAANRMASPEEQAYASAASDFVTAQLRQESGAAIGQDEFDRKYREFFPMPGDDDEQIKLKRSRRNAATLDMINLSGGLYDALYGETNQPSLDINKSAPTQSAEADIKLSPSAAKYLEL